MVAYAANATITSVCFRQSFQPSSVHKSFSLMCCSNIRCLHVFTTACMIGLIIHLSCCAHSKEVSSTARLCLSTLTFHTSVKESMSIQNSLVVSSRSFVVSTHRPPLLFGLYLPNYIFSSLSSTFWLSWYDLGSSLLNLVTPCLPDVCSSILIAEQHISFRDEYIQHQPLLLCLLSFVGYFLVALMDRCFMAHFKYFCFKFVVAWHQSEAYIGVCLPNLQALQEIYLVSLNHVDPCVSHIEPLSYNHIGT